ncbi:HlyD family type I secretion periplasmic adaptor subunit [Aromatoleum petrolei]|uniref:Membrane fusion protein (MFP) family protein n=1 Tax=Aromatoleum petrolei TaxID=76116 RepID=A0ABX1MTS4_9RHOO|nr:HlyD family type I secretion periplasmic adaptor subunit [Aromatoleum petrolei]NMF91355.1 HlyD family type I secretion periplasmic adaptor subunit [Aromatoleum petrolei]QTQ36860.1 Type I secretion membrane fusion protein, HlyD family [Aromatoleum petrolei]
MMIDQTKRLIRVGQLIIAIAFVGLGIWLAFAPLQGAVIMMAQAKVDANRKAVQHNEGGIVNEILVRDGDIVAQGQPLIVLRDAQAEALYSVTHTALDAELARHARLEAEMTGSTPKFPQALLQRKDEPVAAEMMRREQALFEERRRALAAQIALLENQAKSVGDEVEALKAQMEAERMGAAAAEEEMASLASLKDQKFVANTRLLTQKRVISDYRSREEERRSEIAHAQSQREELRLRAVTLRSDLVRQAAEEAKASTTRIMELQDRLRPASDLLQRLTIRAPVAGRVLNLAVHTAGGTIAPRATLMEIVPDTGPLVLEGRVHVDAIKELHIGQGADIRLTALPQRTTPLLPGKVSYISPDALTVEDGATFYLVQLVPDAAEADSPLAQLQPGMAAEVFIRTKPRTALEYLLEPVTDTMMRAFRER